jgi:hypothetical protein
MTKEIDHEGTHQIVCPYCGYEHTDSWELVDEEYPCAQSVQCSSCEKKFMAESFTVTKYNTNKADCLNGGEHDWNEWSKGVPSVLKRQYRQCNGCNKKESREVPQ